MQAHKYDFFRDGRYNNRMDVYDFDNTLYRGDSTVGFTLHCAWLFQRTLPTFPKTALAAIRLGIGSADKTEFKSTLYRFLPYIPDIESEVARFWSTHEHRICGPCEPKEGDLVISASAEFVLNDICTQRGWNLIASQVDPHTGTCLGLNCSGAEKVRRLREAYQDVAVERFFSDSLNDTPLARIAQEAYLVNIWKGTLTPWPNL